MQCIVNAFAPLYNAKLIDSRELIRIVYRFLAEVAPKYVPVGSGAVNPRSVAGKSISPPGAAVDPGTQEADNPEQKNG